MPDAESPKKKLDLPGWIGIILVAVGGLVGALTSYQKGLGDLAIMQEQVKVLMVTVKDDQIELRGLRDRVIVLESRRNK